jgi:hypothetical protein
MLRRVYSSVGGQVLISFHEGGQWRDDCSADEIPLWLLIAILRQVSRRKPLDDQKAEETINAVYQTERDYTQMRAKLDPYQSHIVRARRP